MKASRVKMSRGDRATAAFAYFFIGFIAIACILPLMMCVSASISAESVIIEKGYSIFPQKLSLDTYRYIFGNSGKEIARSYFITTAATVIGTLGSVLITSMMSFALCIDDMKYRNKIAFLCDFTIIFSAGLIPWYMCCVNYYGLDDNVMALIVPSIFSVWNMFLLRTYFKSISQSLYEAARIDGANYFRVYWTIAMPLNKTGLLTVGLMICLQYWNDWWNALMFIREKSLWPLQYFLYNIMSNVNAVQSGRIPPSAIAHIKLPAETVKMAVTIITIGPILFLYPFIQRYFVQGIMTGAVKE